jgi:NAD-dependent dihydropyrimidine dehydrogenase PreA subunit
MPMARLFSVEVNAAYCKGCEICIRLCPKQVLRLDERQKAVVARAGACTGCLVCEISCPDFAIDVEEVEQDG